MDVWYIKRWFGVSSPRTLAGIVSKDFLITTECKAFLNTPLRQSLFRFTKLLRPGVARRDLLYTGISDRNSRYFEYIAPN